MSDKKKLVITAAIAIGLWILLKDPREANATEVDIEPEDQENKGTDPNANMGPRLPIPTEYKPSGVSETDESTEGHQENVNKYVSAVVGNLFMPQKLVSVPTGESPENPLSDPRQGKWYQVQDGDTLINIVRRAGLLDRNWREMRDHINNDWLPKTLPDGSYFPYSPGEKSLPMYKWFEPPGYMTRNLWASKGVYPIIYIPTEDEVR